MEEQVKHITMRAEMMREMRPCYDVLILHVSDAASLGGILIK